MDNGSYATLDPDALSARLVTIAQEARKLAAEGDAVRLHDLLEEVRRSADRAGGVQLALLEVAEAFLRAMARSDLGRSEIALRRLFAEHPDAAEAIFTRLLKPAAIVEEELMSLAGEAQEQVLALIELGVLRRVGKLLDLRPSLRPLARDLLEPAVLRMWRTVQTIRGQAGLARMKPVHATAYMAGQLGITQRQAEVHFAEHPIQPAASVATSLTVQPRVRVSQGASQTSVLQSKTEPFQSTNKPMKRSVAPSANQLSTVLSLPKEASRPAPWLAAVRGAS